MAVNSHSQLPKNPDKKKLQEAKTLVASEQYTQARLLLQELANNASDNPELFYLLGICLFHEKEYLRAMGSFSKANELDPNHMEYRVWLGKCFERNGQQHLAIKTFENVLELDPDNLDALSWKAYIHLVKQDDKQAAECLQRAISLQPSNDSTLSNYAIVLGRTGRYEEALKLINKAIRISPKSASHYMILGKIHRTNGKLDEAERAYIKALEIDPTLIGAYYELVSTKKITNPNNELIGRMERALNRGMTSTNRSYLHFALGEAYNSCKEWDKAFLHFDKANMLVHSRYDPKKNSKEITKFQKIFNSKYLNSKISSTISEYTPIFIVGMPRSGTTLTDQILFSHSRIHSVGESILIGQIAHKICQANSQTPEYPDGLAHVSDEELENARKLYLEDVTKEAGNAKFIVDKMPHNYAYLGLMYMLFPNAKFIHCMRNPLDVCLSCFFTGFTFTEYTWTSKLEYIGKYYRDYLRLMRHWRKVLPVPILDVQYENVVSDFETNAQRILDFCGLEWEAACLEFYNTKRSVATASVVQVRQPIYSSSVERWVPYAKHLQPLVTALGDALEDDAPRLQELGLTVNTKQSLLQRVSAFFHP